MRVHAGNLFLYGFSLLLLYLAGAYFGDSLLFLFYFLLLLPALSVALLLLGFPGLELRQAFSTTGPVKLGPVDYWLTIRNKGVVPVPRVAVAFRSLAHPVGAGIEDFRTYLVRGKAVERRYKVRFPHTGVHELGLAGVEVTDLLQILTLRRAVEPRVFHVYPRVWPVRSLPRGIENLGTRDQGESPEGLVDPSLFNHLREYRRGEPIRSLSWKKFAATGRPFLKEFDRSAGGQVRIYFDVRPSRLAGAAALEEQDGTIEVLVAVVRRLFERGIEALVLAAGDQPYEYLGSHSRHFARFYGSVLTLRFQETISPAALYGADKSSRSSANPSSVLFISHILDPGILEIVEAGTGSRGKAGYLLNVISASSAVREESERTSERLARRGGDLILVRDPGLREDAIA